MELKFPLFFATAFLLTIASCKKSIENNGLEGNWKLIEIYDGYANGGNFKWTFISTDNSHILSFSKDGKYLKTEGVSGNYTECKGTYSLQSGNNLEIHSNCNTVTEKAFISELSPKILILDRSGIEGKIRYKYAAVK